MALFPTNNFGRRNADEIVVIDLGTRVTKAVYLVRVDDKLELLNYSLVEVPLTASKTSVEWLSAHFREVWTALGAKTRNMVVVVGLGESHIWQVDLPSGTKADTRRMIQLNSKAILQEDLKGMVFDSATLGPLPSSETGQVSKRVKALVGAARTELIETLQNASRLAGLNLDMVTLGKLSPAQAFMLMPEETKKDVIALVHIGYSGSTISFLQNGELLLIREVSIGDHKLTTDLAESLNVNYQVAEAVKLTMPNKILGKLQTVIAPLSRELRTSIDFCEHQYEKTVSKVYLSGGPTRSPILLQALQSELHLPCSTWTPRSYVDFSLPQPQSDKLEQELPQLFVAIGAGAAYFHPELPSLNLLAEQQEMAESRRRNPLKRVALFSLLLLAAMFLWLSYYKFLNSSVARETSRFHTELRAIQPAANAVNSNTLRISQIQGSLGDLEIISSNRYQWGPFLQALQHVMLDQIQVIRVTGDRHAVHAPAVKASTNRSGKVLQARPASTTERIIFSIQAKDYGDPPSTEKFMAAIASEPYMREFLREVDPVALKNRNQRQSDPDDPTKSFIVFTIECYVERVFNESTR